MCKENRCECEVGATAEICGFCSEMLYAAQWEVRCTEVISALHAEVGELQAGAATTAQLEEQVEAALEENFDRYVDRAVDNGDILSESHCETMIEDALRDYKSDHEDDVADALQDYMNSSDTVSEIEATIAAERREIDRELAELDSQLAAMPTTFAERLRWLFTGVARRAVVISAAK